MHTHALMNVPKHTHTHSHTHTHMHMNTRMCKHTHTCTRTATNVHTHAYTRTFTALFLCMCTVLILSDFLASRTTYRDRAGKCYTDTQTVSLPALAPNKDIYQSKAARKGLLLTRHTKFCKRVLIDAKAGQSALPSFSFESGLFGTNVPIHQASPTGRGAVCASSFLMPH